MGWSDIREANERISLITGMALVLPNAQAKSGDRIRNGTFTFVETGLVALAITCHHVYDKFRTQRKEKPETILAVALAGSEILDVSDSELIDEDVDYDLAILKFRQPGMVRRYGKRYHKLASWPPPRPRVGDIAFAVGYPGVLRQPNGDCTIDFRPGVILDHVTSVSERHIVVFNENDDRLNDPEFIIPLNELGGMSGGPLVTGNSQGNCDLTGIIYAGSIKNTNFIYASHLDFINQDGTIR